MIDADVPLPPRPAQPESTAALAVQLDRSERRISVSGELDIATVPVLAQVMATLLDLAPRDSTVGEPMLWRSTCVQVEKRAGRPRQSARAPPGR